MLAIETSNPSAAAPGSGPGAGVALGALEGSSATLLGTEPLLEERAHDDDLLPAIDRLTRRYAATPRQIARVAVSVGPGGFTALRIAVAAAKMIAEATGAGCVAVPSALVVARRTDHNGRPFAVALSSKGDSAFVTLFDGPRPRAPGTVMTAADVASLDVALLVADRFLPESIRNVCAQRSIAVVPPRFDPAACLEAALELPDIDPVELLPIYPRLPEAVVKWRQFHGGTALQSGDRPGPETRRSIPPSE